MDYIIRSLETLYLSSPSNLEIKNAWSYTSDALPVSMAWCLVKHSDNFIFIVEYLMRKKLQSTCKVTLMT
jgi:hypothetical protein